MVRTDIPEERVSSIFRVRGKKTREIRESEVTLRSGKNRRLLRSREFRLFFPLTLKMEATRSSETSVLTINTRRKIPEDGLLHSHRRENLKSYITLHVHFTHPVKGTHNNRATIHVTNMKVKPKFPGVEEFLSR
jgi:hypothetical protein